MQLTFLGATQTVTGSRFLVEHRDYKILVDCGLFQGLKEYRLRNWSPFPIPPSSIDAVVLTHAHIDHSGYLPVLVRDGFRGPIYCTAATRDLCSILLPDSGHIHEEDARRANRYGYSKHHPARPLYTEADAVRSLEQLEVVELGVDFELAKDLTLQLNRSGHILGSAFVTLKDDNHRLVFSGDLGRLHDPLMKAPATLQEADYLLLESTYGARLHDTTDPLEVLGKVINKTIGRGGTVVIPAFAVGRTQSLLYFIYLLKENKEIPDVPVYLDSPLAVNATYIMQKYGAEHRLSGDLCRKACSVATYVQSPEDSKALHASPMPSVIISASGMATGGRVLHHLKHYAPGASNTILLSGFQAAGTRGDRLLRGERELKIHGQMIPIRAEIQVLGNTSAHADYSEILEWLEGFRKPPVKVFLTHGEVKSAQSLRTHIEERFQWNVEIPDYLDKVEI